MAYPDDLLQYARQMAELYPNEAHQPSLRRALSSAYCAKGTLRRKKDQLEQALQAKLTSHQRFMLRELLDDLKFVEGKIARLEETIQERVTPHEEVLNHLNTIPGINHLTASTLIAELGVEMQQFPDARHLASCKIVPAGAEMAACHAFDFPGSDEGGEATASFDLCPRYFTPRRLGTTSSRQCRPTTSLLLRSIVCRFLHVVHHEHIDRRPLRLQPQPEPPNRIAQ